MFFDGQDAFAAMLSAVESAREEILLESYIFKDDPTGRRFQAGLIAAARRGVSVRVLADGIGSIETRRGFWKEMAEGGVDARLFRPIGFFIRSASCSGATTARSWSPTGRSPSRGA